MESLPSFGLRLLAQIRAEDPFFNHLVVRVDLTISGRDRLLIKFIKVAIKPLDIGFECIVLHLDLGASLS